MASRIPIAFALIAALIAGCASLTIKQGEEEAGGLRVYGNLSTLEVAPLLLAVDQYYPAVAPVQMGGIPRLLNEPGIPGFDTQGQADVATHAETQALKYSVDHPDLRIILTVAEGHYRIVARRSAGIQTIKDLEGKTVGTVPNTSSAYFLEMELNHAGVDPDTVGVQRVWPLSEMPDAILSGEVDAITIWEPHMEVVMLALGEDAVVLNGASGYREIFNLNTTTHVLDDPGKRAQLVKLVGAIMCASDALKNDPGHAQNLVANASGYTPALVTKAWPHQSYPARLSPDLLPIMVAQEKWLAAMADRPVRAAPVLARLIDSSVQDEARQISLSEPSCGQIKQSG